MNGARGISETSREQQKRISSGRSRNVGRDETRAYCLTRHAADYFRLKLPWQGLSSSAILLETSSRQLVPVFVHSSELGACEHGGSWRRRGRSKTCVTAHCLLTHAGPDRREISILERGDQYPATRVELMGRSESSKNLDAMKL